MEGNYFAEMVVAKDKSEAVLTVFRALVIANSETKRIYPVGLDEDAVYRIPELELELHGSTIMNLGLVPRFAREDFAALVYHFEKI
jgi:alpha-galactosidase